MVKKLKVKLQKTHALEVTRIAIGNTKLVYVLIANKKLPYSHGKKSAIAYIGTTKRGVRRVAGSAAAHAEEILTLYGVKKVTARILTCQPRPRVKTWLKLERAMILMFRSEYGTVPKFNLQGKKMREGDEFDYLSRERIRKTIQMLG